jgi:hypothetical protein
MAKIPHESRGGRRDEILIGIDSLLIVASRTDT